MLEDVAESLDVFDWGGVGGVRRVGGIRPVLSSSQVLSFGNCDALTILAEEHLIPWSFSIDESALPKLRHELLHLITPRKLPRDHKTPSPSSFPSRISSIGGMHEYGRRHSLRTNHAFPLAVSRELNFADAAKPYVRLGMIESHALSLRCLHFFALSWRP